MKFFIFFNWLLLFSYSLFSQTFKKQSFLYEKGKQVCEKYTDMIPCKTYVFYENKEYDSCYVFSEKSLSVVKDKESKDFFLFLRSFSAYKKGLYKNALLTVNRLNNKKLNAQKEYLLGLVHFRLKEYDKAITNIEKWIILDTLASPLYKKAMLHNLASCYLHKKNYKKAKYFFDEKFKLLNSSDTSSVIKFKTDIANVYYNQYLDDKAIPLFKEAYDLSKVFSDLELKQNTAKNMAVVEKNRKQFKESVDYYIEYGKWKDSIWSRDRIWQLTEKDKKIAVAQKQQEIAVQDEQIKRQRVVQKGLILGASGLLVFLGGLTFFYRKLKSKNKLINEQKEALNTANKTKDYLFSVVSHDLRSPINTIKRQHKKLAKHIANNDLSAIKEATKSAIAVTESTSHLLNNVLHWSLEQSKMLNFSQEKQALKPIIEHVLFDYEEIADSKDISIHINLAEEILVLLDKESLKIVIRNLIDNSIKYMNGSGSIAVKTEKHSETQARIEIKDSGIGISEEKLQKINALKDLSIDKIDRSKGIGLGLLLCQTLIKKNNGALFFESQEGVSTTAIILLPLA
ncbi:tetratricopeptide repeat-containing sensor histidine kinase [Tenacibaculum soleae]|uniref:tetratricopeptide repeat-containing sensor histidine kinase n=1 Tax=Tenacibaculum soleae TaxID=447689 RepID=UPI0026E31C21|nr:tetratricopeptide repeat-containing sensor histidine kinase [Tenacibaculum soleae]MDO6744330.1 tetratricopeptide repeat-containing sensor histidine kinase [Tenacibaculum soleae]